jgi:hypothetical protein
MTVLKYPGLKHCCGECLNFEDCFHASNEILNITPETACSYKSATAESCPACSRFRDGKKNKPLHLVLTAYWFNEIKDGRKTHEYRLYNDYWKKRISHLLYTPEKTTVIFHRGYTAETVCRKIKAVKILTSGQETDLHSAGPVFDLELE